MGDAPKNTEGVFVRLTVLFPLFLVYVFAAGWIYLNTYLAAFGLQTRSLGVESNEVLMRSFLLLVTPSNYLWIVYLVLFLLPLVLGANESLRRSVWASIIGLGVYALGAVIVYPLCGRAGSLDAQRDQGKETRLPAIEFTIKACAPAPASRCHTYGRLLWLREKVYFVFLPESGGTAIDTSSVHIFPAEEINDVVIRR